MAAPMEPRETAGKEPPGPRKKNLHFLRPRLYMLERRKTDTMVEGSVTGERAGPLRRSQSDRSEYSQKLQGNQNSSTCKEKQSLQEKCGWKETRQ